MGKCVARVSGDLVPYPSFFYYRGTSKANAREKFLNDYPGAYNTAAKEGTHRKEVEGARISQKNAHNAYILYTAHG